MKKKRKKLWDGNRTHAVARAFGIEAPTTSKEKTLSPNEIGKIFDVTGEAVKQWIYHRRLPAVKLANGYWRVKRSDLESFIADRYASSRANVLVASGEVSTSAQLEEVIRSLDLNAIVALNAVDAILKCRQCPPALAIIDVSAWDDAWQLATKLKNNRFSQKIPMLLISQTALSEAQSDKAIELKAVGCIPLEKDLLAREISRIIQYKMMHTHTNSM